MIAARNYMYPLFKDFIDESMFVVDASGPAPLKYMFERFRLSGSFERCMFDLFD